jgi:hypothetical protein
MKTIKKHLNLSMLPVIFLISQCAASVAPGWIVQQVSQGGYITSDSTVRLSGQNVFWQEYIDGMHQTMFWNGSAITRITDTNHECEPPDIWGTNAVWREYLGTPQIMFFNGTTTMQVTGGTNYRYGPRVSGSHIVWVEQISGIYSIMFYDGNSIRSISGGYESGQPAIWDSNVIWPKTVGTNHSMMFWDGVNTIVIAQTGVYCSDLQLSRTGAVWLEKEDESFSSGTVKFWNGSTVQQLSTSAEGGTQPHIWDSNVVWIEDNQVKLWNGATTVLTANSKQKSDPAIWDNIVVWSEKPSGVPVLLIYLWDGNETVRLTDMPGCRMPSVSQGNVVWIGYNDDYDYQVMFAQRGTIPESLPGDLNEDNSVDMIDFSIFSNNWLRTVQ